MKALIIPRNPSAITPQWLTNALRSRGIIHRASVISVHLEAQLSLATQRVLLTLTYDINEKDAPNALIAKFPSMNPFWRSFVANIGGYEREIRFYEEIAPQINLRTPRLCYSAFDGVSGSSTLLIEYLANTHPPNSLDEAKNTCAAIAQFHARWWESPQLVEMDWMPFVMTNNVEADPIGYLQAWDVWKNEYSDLLPDRFNQLCCRYGECVNQVRQKLEAAPRTIVHNDFYAANILYEDDTNAPIVIDWLPIRGPGVIDVAYFLVEFLSSTRWDTQWSKRRKTIEMALLKGYHTALLENGVRAYSFEQTLLDYRLSMLIKLQRSIHIGAALWKSQVKATDRQMANVIQELWIGRESAASTIDPARTYIQEVVQRYMETMANHDFEEILP